MSTTSTGAITRTSTRKRLGLSIAAAAVIGALLPLGAGPTQAMAGAAPSSAAKPKPAKPGFSGYSTTAVGSPIKVEIYEPTIPIPATPQAELEYGYTAVQADSSGSRARSSYLWPGSPVGEGFKVIVDNLHLPPEIAGPLGEGGYPIQVNAVYPGGPEEQADEPAPGSIQRAKATEGEAIAANGFSSDGEAVSGDDSGDGGGDGGGNGGGGLPLPGVPGLPGLSGGSGGLSGLFGTSRGAALAAPGDPAPAPGLPPELAALVDIGGFSSVSKTTNADTVFSQSRSGVSDVTLLGGLVTIDGVNTVARTTSDGAKGVAEGEADYGDIIAFGQRFKFGPDGYEAAGQGGAIPGLPDDASKALEQIGLKIIVPQAQYTTDKDAASSTVPGLILDFDLTTLRGQIGPVSDALNGVINQIPNETGQLKSLIQAAANLSPRMVFTLGLSTTSVDTSQPIALPPLVDPEPIVDPTGDPTDTTGSGTSGSTGGGSSDTGGSVTPPSAGAPAGDTPPAQASDLVPTAAAQQPGLPALFSIPTLLLLLGVGLAAVLGTFVRRMGLAVLGGNAACPHGLDSGLPDLRKVQ